MTISSEQVLPVRGALVPWPIRVSRADGGRGQVVNLLSMAVHPHTQYWRVAWDDGLTMWTPANEVDTV